MKKFHLFYLFFLGVATAPFAQSYNTAGGLRLGTDWGLTLQQRVAKKSTVEAIIQSSLQREEVLFTAMYEQHYPLLTKRLNFYAGAGLHKGWNTTNVGPTETITADPFGVTLVGGAETTLGRLNLSWDFKPAINLQGGEKKFYTQSGVSLRYVIAKKVTEKDREKRRRKKDRQKRREQNPDWWKVWKNL